MGAIGLNFGSPTSGAGFNVSSTVASIVSNLQMIETPWKNQLTTLQGQDTAISSLGTLLSNLSNDVSQLTDFQGALEQKTGASSNTGVLELTSASSSATAGTHSVTVNSLAQTASGYLAPITNASDKLSGSITVQVGTGTAQTIALNSSNNTLAGLAAAINSSGVGIKASVLTDATGSRLSMVSGTSGVNGNIAVTANSIADATTHSGTLGYTSPVSGKNASLTVDGVTLSSASNTVTNLIPGLTFQLLATSAVGSDGNPQPVQVVIANDNSSVVSTVNQLVSDYNSLIGAIGTQEGNTSSGTPQPLFGSPTLSLIQQQLLSSINVVNPNGYLDSLNLGNNPSVSGSISIQVGSGAAQVVTLSSSQTSLADLADAINAAHIGATAAVVTKYGQSTLTLASQTAGSAGALTVQSNIVAVGGTQLSDTTISSGGGQNSSSSFGSIPNGSDVLAGSVTIAVGGGQAVTVNVPDPANTLAGLADAINNTSGIGVTASIATATDGSQSLSLVSQTAGSAGDLTVTSNLVDTTDTTSATLNYTNSSDITNLSGLGISANNDGTLTLDASSLDSTLNSDFQSVVSFFQNANSWGQNFSAMLTNAGESSKTGILALASNTNSTIESQLNARIAKEEARISIEQASLTNELNLANQIFEQLPNQLSGMDEIYSAITGYNKQGG